MSYSLHNHKMVKTRKEHKCEGCFEAIPRGSLVAHNKGKWQGDWYDYHMCQSCDDYINEYMRDTISDEGFTPGEIGAHRREMGQHGN
jgi:Pyruvate/2-oxoacid:ferredoxin oxidoreductase delta subunit